MNTKLKLVALNFLEFFVWGSWLISLGGYMFTLPGDLNTRGSLVGATYATMGIASLIMPAIMGIIADRYASAQKVLGFCHIAGAGFLFWAAQTTDANQLYWIILLNSLVYMPTIALNNTVSYIVLNKNGLDVVKVFPPIRVWGTVGFIAAMWLVDLQGWTKSPMQFQVAAIAALVMGLYSFTLPNCEPAQKGVQKNWVQALGLDAFILFKQPKMAIFFIFSMLLGAALQITNAFGEPFIHDFEKIPEYAQTFGVKHPSLLISISQISETLFILTIPFFLKKFGIKQVMLISIFAWVFRFGLFAIGDPGDGLIWLILSMIIYGMAFDFFNISGSLFVDKESPKAIRASAQGLFMLMTNGLGAYLGGVISGAVVDYYTIDTIKNWQAIWLVFAAYALVLGIVFPFVFRYKHNPQQDLYVSH
jgi:MFS transporter, NHS family, xanthosine permease